VTALNRGAGVGIPLADGGWDFSLDPKREPSVEEIWDAACKAATASLSDGKDVRGLDWFRENGLYAVPFPRLEWYLYPAMVEQGLRFEMPYQERFMRTGVELGRRLHEHGMHWWDEQLTEYMSLPEWHDVPGRWEKSLRSAGADPKDFPFWMLTTKSMQYHCGGNASIQLMHEVSQNVRGHGGLVLNDRTAAALGIARDDLVEICSAFGSTRGRAIPSPGIRPDTVVAVGQFDHWVTPYAKDIHAPSMNPITPMSLELTDGAGSGADVVRVTLRRLGGGRREAATGAPPCPAG
jgi:phenylacetyl-CoA:acceptor oxidoreductase